MGNILCLLVCRCLHARDGAVSELPNMAICAGPKRGPHDAKLQHITTESLHDTNLTNDLLFAGRSVSMAQQGKQYVHLGLHPNPSSKQDSCKNARVTALKRLQALCKTAKHVQATGRLVKQQLSNKLKNPRSDPS